MTQEQKLKDLINRIKELEGPSREVDILLAELIDFKEGLAWSVRDALKSIETAELALQACAGHSCFNRIPRFTASIDAAVSFIADGWVLDKIEVLGDDGGTMFYRVQLVKCSSFDDPATYAVGEWYKLPHAILIAALQARIKEPDND